MFEACREDVKSCRNVLAVENVTAAGFRRLAKLKPLMLDITAEPVEIVRVERLSGIPTAGARMLLIFIPLTLESKILPVEI